MSWVTIKEAARLTGCSSYCVRKGIKSGRFPHIMLSGQYMVNPDTVEECLQNEARINQQKAREQCQSNQD